jgi:hypothetical protein
VHQFRSEFEIVEAGLAFLGVDDEIFEFPGNDRCLGLRFATRAGRFRRFGADRFGGGSGLRLRLGCRYRSRMFSLGSLAARAGGVRRRTGDWRELLSLAFTVISSIG